MAIPVQSRLNIPTAADREGLKQFACKMRVMVPAQVVSFDPGGSGRSATVSVQPTVMELMRQDGVPTPVSLPILDDVPVSYPHAGGFSITFPIKPGDECMVVFADMAYDLWWQNGGVQQQPQGKLYRHDLGDAIAVFGLDSCPNALQDWSTDSLQVRSDDGAVTIDVADAGITLTAPEVTLVSGNGTAQGLVTKAAWDWLLTNIVPRVPQTSPIPPVPTDAVTAIVKAQ